MTIESNVTLVRGEIADVYRIPDGKEVEESMDDKIISDRHWEAFLLAARGERGKALEVASGDADPTCEWKSGKPENIDTFFDKLLVDSLWKKPQQMNSLGLLESIGVKEHNRFLDDHSVAHKRERLEAAKENLRTLSSYSINSLDHDRQISYKIFQWLLHLEVEGEPFLFHEYPVNQMFGCLNALTETFTQYHKLESREDFSIYLERLGRISDQLQQIKFLVEHQQQRGVVPPKFAIERVLSGLQKLLDLPIEQNPFYLYAEEHSKSVRDSDGISLGVYEVLKSEVLPAYRNFADFLAGFCKSISTNHSLLGLPRGREFYEYCLKREITTDLSPEEIYQIGLREVESIQSEMRRLLASVGISDDDKTVGELMDRLAEDESFFFPNTKEGKEACIERFHQILERSRKELSQYFDHKPALPVKIIPTPAHEEEGMPGAYYYEPSLDGSRPGTFYVNLRDTKENPKFGMETLLVHEAEPGHHFQLALQSQSDIHALRRIGVYNAYCEGWALYTEKLAYEVGFYSSAYDQLGHLQDELLRAVRLVVDPAIHAMGWTREEAIEYMLKQTGYKRETVVTEIERYFVMPGQACSYKIGQLKILELRERAKMKLGEKFDIRKFHNVILEVGACPLAILEEVVDRYIAEVSEA